MTPGKLSENYKGWVARSSLERSSRVVFGLDLENGSPSKLYKRATILLDGCSEYFCAIKFGRHTVLNLGTSLTQKLIRRIHSSGLPTIIDDKLSDIDATNLGIARAYYRMGFDGIIVNPSTGWEGGLQPVFQTSHQLGRGVIVLVYMSHPGASTTFGQRLAVGRGTIYQYERYAKNAAGWNADGAVVGATRPRIIEKVKPVLGRRVPIYSPGIGTQGGGVDRARRAGTDYFIIGRSIAKAANPTEMAEKFARESV